MGMRKDALCAAAEIVTELEKDANEEAVNSTVGTIGYIANSPNAFNVIPGSVKMGIDIRGINKVDRKTLDCIDRVCRKRELEYGLVPISKAEPVKLDDNLKNSLTETAEELGIKYMVMNSGAGHDAMKFANIAPTGMVFIPCREGISHNKDESIDFEDVVLGSRIIFEQIKKISCRK